MAPRRRVVLASAALLIAIAAVFAGFAMASAPSPEQTVRRYMEQVMRSDPSGALSLWEARTFSGFADRTAALNRRRDLVTAELIGARPTTFRVVGIELWRTCCEPGLAEKPEYAGLARIHVAMELQDGVRDYFFDVRREPDCCIDNPFDLRPHSWVLRDAYPATKLPIDLPWVYDPARGAQPIVGVSEP